MAKLLMTVEQMQDREAWLKVREMGIGGSDAAAVLGQSKFKTPFALWAEKTHKVDPKDISDNEYVYWGNKLEPQVAEEFAKQTGKKVKKQGIMQSTEYPWMLASIDRLIVGEKAGLECKTARGWAGSEWENDEIPTGYYWQCLHYMATLGKDIERWYIAVLIDGYHFVWKTIERKDVQGDIDYLIEEESKFWNENVLKDITPSVDSSEQCKKILSSRYKATKDEEIPIDSKQEELCKQYMIAKMTFDVAEENLEQLHNEMAAYMGENALATNAEYKVSYKWQNGPKSFNKDAFKEKYPDIDIEPFYKQSQYRKLSITKKKQKAKKEK